MLTIDIITLAAIGGFIPALAWLWFWLRKDKHPEPWIYITLTFVAGIIAVPIIIPFQEPIYQHLFAIAPILTLFLLAGLEEVFKYAAAYFAALRNPVNDEPIDPIIYLITAALGFAALETTLYLLTPISEGDIMGSIQIGNLRFIGAALIHVASSATLGLFLAISFQKPIKNRIFYIIAGLVVATLVHTAFNVGVLMPNINNLFVIFSFFFIIITFLPIILKKVNKL